MFCYVCGIPQKENLSVLQNEGTYTVVLDEINQEEHNVFVKQRRNQDDHNKRKAKPNSTNTEGDTMKKVEGQKFLSDLLDIEPILDDDIPSNQMRFYDKKRDLTLIMTFHPPVHELNMDLFKEKE